MKRLGVERILVDRHRRIKAQFNDGTLLLLSSQARFYIHVDADGSASRHFTQYALHRQRRYLQHVLSFRNRYFRDSFYEPWVMNEALVERKLPNADANRLSWPSSLDEARDRKLVFVKEHTIHLNAKDERFRCVLDPVGKRVMGRMPMRRASSDGRHSHVIAEDKIFPLRDAPAEWRHLLQLTTEALTLFADVSHFRVETAQEIASAIDDDRWRETHMPAESEISEFGNDTWWLRHTTVLPDDAVIVMDWRPDAVYFFRPSDREVSVWIARDGSLLETTHDGGFFKHRRRSPFRERIYTASTVPSSVLDENGNVLYALAAIADHAIKMR